MKRVFVVIMVLLLAGVASNVYGADLSYEPGTASFELAPGETAEQSVTVMSSNQRSRMIYVNMGGSVSGGNLPPEWVGGRMAPLTSMSGTAATSFYVRVPEGAEAGTYYGVVLPSVQGGRETVNTGDGVSVTVEVKQSCSGTPAFSNVRIGPEEISVRKNKPVEIEVTGSVSVPDGCVLSGLEYTLKDEYGELGTDSPQKVEVSADGSFRITEIVNASRKGEDKDGRNYTVTVSASDALGNVVSEGFVVTVSHDNRGGNSDGAKGNNGKALGKDKGNGPDDNNGKAKGKDK